MKKLIFTLLVFLPFYFQNVYSQTENWKILTVARPLTSINFISPTKAWIYGGDIAYKTTDGGLTWSLPIIQNPSIGGYGIYFLDSLKGWACNYSNSLLKTTNGGNSWYIINTGISSVKFQAVFFINANTGWVGGFSYNPQPNLYKTTNGGLNFISQNSNSSSEIISLYMINDLKGFYCRGGPTGLDTIGYTTNGGNNWLKRKIGNGQGARKITFVDSLNGWMLGYGYPNYVSRTTDGGNNWIVHTYSSGDVRNIFFLNNLTGWIVGSGERIWKTINGGINWNLIRGPLGTSSPTSDIYDIFFTNVNTGWCAGHEGRVLKSTNGGTNWIYDIYGPIGSINSMHFTDINTGWLLSSFSDLYDHSYLWKTSNRGYNWIEIKLFDDNILNSFHFIDNQNCFICGNSGIIFKTTNSGNNWDSIIAGNGNYKSICFVNNSTGWCCGSAGTIIKTTNAGFNWISQVGGTSYNLNKIKFLDLSTGYIAGDSGNVLRTTNGGTNWLIDQPLGSHAYSSLFFINNSTGWVIGNKYSGGMYGGTEKVIIKTTDGGSNWLTLYSNFTVNQSPSFMSIYFINDQIGWIVTKLNGILNTTNGGINWISNPSPFQNEFYTIFFSNNETGWIAGNYGTVLTTASPIGIQNINSEIPEYFSLSQNYPNPFNPITKIKFSLPSPSKGGVIKVKLIIYDVLGREIETLVNDFKKPGVYEVDWDGSNYSSGIYFYRLITDDFTETKKMVLIR